MDDELAKKPDARSGAIFAVAGPAESALKPAGEWNELQVICAGDRVRVRLNGQETADLDLEGYPALRGRPSPGYIGLYNWRGMAKGTAFRNIRAREMQDGSSATFPATSRLEPIREPNTSQHDSFAWVSRDGLRIYFTRHTDAQEKPKTYFAARTHSRMPFGPAQYLISMRHTALSGDELLMVGFNDDHVGAKLHQTRRDRVLSDFAPPTVIEELADQKNAKSPWLSTDGLTLVFQRHDPEGDYPGKASKDNATSQTEFVICDRPSVDSKWSKPRPIPLEDDPLYNDALTWPMLSDDGLTLFFCNGGGRLPEVVYATREHPIHAFADPRKVMFDGQPLLGRAPRYVPATKELVVGRYAGSDNGPENWDLWVVKDFVPEAQSAPWGRPFRPRPNPDLTP